MWSAIVGVGLVTLAVVAVYVVGVIPVALQGFQAIPEVLVAIAAVLSFLYLAMAYGLWTLRPWARLLAIVFAFVTLAFGMLTLPLGLASVLVSLATVWYLSEHKVRATFRRAR